VPKIGPMLYPTCLRRNMATDDFSPDVKIGVFPKFDGFYHPALNWVKMVTHPPHPLGWCVDLFAWAKSHLLRCRPAVRNSFAGRIGQ
jgi:hypothetical protein